MSINIGIIGFGWMGQIHAKLLKSNDDCIIKAIADKDYLKLEEGKKLYNIDVYQDYHELLDLTDIDTVFISTPAKFHYQIVRDSVEAGKNILCEKPLSLTREEVNSLRLIVNKSDKKFIICFPERFVISSQETKDIINEGLIGKIDYIRGNCRFSMKEHNLTHGNWVFDRKQGGGLILEASVHLWDFIRWLTVSEIIKVVGVAHEYLKKGSAIEDNFAAIAYIENGCIACIDMSGSLPKDSATDKRFEIIGSEGYIYIDEFRNYMTINTEKGIDATPGASVKGMTHKDFMWDSYVEGGVKRLQEYFINCLKMDKKPEPGIEDAAKSCEITWALMDSLKSQKLETVTYGL